MEKDTGTAFLEVTKKDHEYSELKLWRLHQGLILMPIILLACACET